MKPLILIVLLVAAVAGYLVFTSGSGSNPTTTAPQGSAQPTNALPIWQQPLPPNTELVPEGQAKLHVEVVRRNENNKAYLDFNISEEHGYMVDGVQVEFWFRFKDEDSGEWIESTNRNVFFVRERVPANETLVASTILRDMDYRNEGIDLPATVSEDWGARILEYTRAIMPAK
ncbi:MAG: hypothetical protein H6817_02345 [Phycisphaerales bacterium]|nr:hypothetical protein [Phycisphaerales bacterium]